MKLQEAKDRLLDARYEMESIENRLDLLQFNDPERARCMKDLREATIKATKLRLRIAELEGIREV